MTDFDELKHVLLRTAMDGEPEPSDIRYETAQEGVAAVLQMIDRQVLPQKLEFTFEDGARIACMAAARRLLRLLEPAPRNLSPNKVALFVKDEVGPEDAQTIGDLFQGLCERGREVSVASRPAVVNVDPGLSGISVNDIAEGLDLSLPEAPASRAKAFESFIEAISPEMIEGVSCQNDEMVIIKGEDDNQTIEVAQNLLNTLLAPSFPLLGTMETQCLMTFGHPSDEGRHVILAGRLGTFVIATLKGHDVAPTIDRWRDAGL